MAVKNGKENTRERIINSAKKLFAEQGYQKTTIVDISRQANLSEAALYEYFQGKEDLLLTIPDLWVSELLKDIDEQLFGIKGAANKLRKYLWWYLRRIEQAPMDAKIVYLFLKTNANFMTTEVYSNVRKLFPPARNLRGRPQNRRIEAGPEPAPGPGHLRRHHGPHHHALAAQGHVLFHFRKPGLSV